MSLFDRVMSTLRRREARDAFSDDDAGFDDFEEDDNAMPVGRKVALALSGTLFLLLAGGGVAIWYVGKDAGPPPMAMASLTDLKVEDGPDEPAKPMAPAAPPAPGPAAKAGAPGAKPAAPPAPAAKDIAATDRSAERRPWLTNAAPSAAPPAAKPAAPMTPPPPAPAQVAKAMPPVPAAPTPAPTAAPTKMESPAKPEPAPVAVTQAPAPAEMPSVLGDAAPGAPERFVAAGAATAGGRPRLNEPPLPPTDRKTLSAAPPRFANISDLKTKVVAYTKTPPEKTVRNGKVAVVVRGLGLSQAATEAAVTKLPPAVTLSFSPYAQNLKKWLDTAKARGHEVLVEMPMESKQFPAEDPGPLGLMTSLEAKKNGERMDSILKAVPGAIGIDDSMGSKFRESEGNMNGVFTKLKEKNLIYVQTQPGVLLGEPGVPHAVADVVMDERPFRAAIDARLDYVERLAKFQGSAVTVMAPKPVSFERLALWIETLNGKGIALAPVSEVLVR